MTSHMKLGIVIIIFLLNIFVKLWSHTKIYIILRHQIFRQYQDFFSFFKSVFYDQISSENSVKVHVSSALYIVTYHLS